MVRGWARKRAIVNSIKMMNSSLGGKPGSAAWISASGAPESEPSGFGLPPQVTRVLRVAPSFILDPCLKVKTLMAKDHPDHLSFTLWIGTRKTILMSATNPIKGPFHGGPSFSRGKIALFYFASAKFFSPFFLAFTKIAILPCGCLFSRMS